MEELTVMINHELNIVEAQVPFERKFNDNLQY